MPRAESRIESRIGSPARLGALVLAAVLAVVAGCARTNDPRVDEYELRGVRAPHFSLLAIDGRPLSLRAHRGEVVVVAFFATWCEPCKEVLPALESLRAKYASHRVAILGVSVDDDPRGLADYASACGLTFPIGWDAGQEVARPWYVRDVPAEFVVDRGGVVRAAFIGYADGVDVEIEREVLKVL